MNRRNFFGTVGAAIAGVALWRNAEAESSPLHARVFIKDEVRTCEGGIYLGNDGEYHPWDRDHPVGETLALDDNYLYANMSEGSWRRIEIKGF